MLFMLKNSFVSICRCSFYCYEGESALIFILFSLENYPLNKRSKKAHNANRTTWNKGLDGDDVLMCALHLNIDHTKPCRGHSFEVVR